MASKKNTVSGIDINLKNIVYVRCIPEERVINNICIQPLEHDGDDYFKSVQTGFDQFIKKFSTPGDDVVSCLPGEFALVKKVSIDADEENPREMIEWELSQQMIGTLNDYVYDYQPISASNDKEQQRFLVVGYRNSTVGRLNRMLKAKKLNPLVLDLDIFALANVFELNYPERVSSPALIIFSDGIKIKTILTAQKEFVDFEIFDHTEDAHTVEGFVQKIMTAKATLQESNASVLGNGSIQLFLTGAFFAQENMAASVAQACGGCELLNPLKTIKCSAGMDAEKLNEYTCYLAIAVGLAFRELE